MAPVSLVPSLDADVHLVLCRFGRAGLAYVETDPAEADATTVVQNLLNGRYRERVIALNVDDGWSKDVSEAMARTVREIAEHEDYELTQGTLDFIDAHLGRVRQPTLPLCEAFSVTAPNFARLDVSRPEVMRLVAAMLQARQAVVQRSCTQ
jgi:hypothetical protein